VKLLSAVAAAVVVVVVSWLFVIIIRVIDVGERQTRVVLIVTGRG